MWVNPHNVETFLSAPVILKVLQMMSWAGAPRALFSLLWNPLDWVTPLKENTQALKNICCQTIIC